MVAAVVGALTAGCSFDVIGVNTGDPSAPQDPSAPTQSVPSGGSDGGTTTTQPAPPSGTPDMAQQRIGTACTSNAQCDPGLICAQTSGIGPGAIVIPGGYCTHECSSSTCPANSVCTQLSFGKYCLSSCPPDPCRPMYKCCSIKSGDKACLTDQLCSSVD